MGSFLPLQQRQEEAISSLSLILETETGVMAGVLAFCLPIAVCYSNLQWRIVFLSLRQTSLLASREETCTFTPTWS